MARVTPSQAAEKYARRASAASQDYLDGVQRVTQAPGAIAATKGQKALTNYQARINDGSWAAAVGAVTLSDWQRAAREKGGARYAGGVQAAQAKVQTVMQKLLPAVDAAASAAKAMPDLTLDQRIARSVKFQQEMAKFRK